jgi:surfeit locus 1 family protein
MPLLTIFAVAGFVLLIWLGNWQYARYSEKKAQSDNPVDPFDEVVVEIDTSNTGFAQQVYGIIDGEAVWRRYVPGRIDGEGSIVLVLWNATSGTEPVPLAVADTGPYSRRSNVFERPAQTGGLAGSSKPDRDLWYGFHGPAMLSNLGYETEETRVIEPDEMTIQLSSDLSRSRRTENPYATLQGRDPLPPERHFGYALTWWGMAIGLLGVYLAFHRAQGRLKFGSR